MSQQCARLACHGTVDVDIPLSRGCQTFVEVRCVAEPPWDHFVTVPRYVSDYGAGADLATTVGELGDAVVAWRYDELPCTGDVPKAAWQRLSSLDALRAYDNSPPHRGGNASSEIDDGTACRAADKPVDCVTYAYRGDSAP